MVAGADAHAQVDAVVVKDAHHAHAKRAEAGARDALQLTARAKCGGHVSVSAAAGGITALGLFVLRLCSLRRRRDRFGCLGRQPVALVVCIRAARNETRVRDENAGVRSECEELAQAVKGGQPWSLLPRVRKAKSILDAEQQNQRQAHDQGDTRLGGEIGLVDGCAKVRWTAI